MKACIASSVITLIAVLLNGCGKPQETQSSSGVGKAANTVRKASWHKPGVAFQARWNWSSSDDCTAVVALTIIPTITAQNLRIQTHLPANTTLTKGDLRHDFPNPVANNPVNVTFDVVFPAGHRPMIPVEVLLVVGEEHQYAATIPVCDPDAPPLDHSEKPGVTTDVGGFPARIGGEAQPPKR